MDGRPQYVVRYEDLAPQIIDSRNLDGTNRTTQEITSQLFEKNELHRRKCSRMLTNYTQSKVEHLVHETGAAGAGATPTVKFTSYSRF